jgi:uncharacterized protein
VTTTLVRGETWTLINRREGHPAAVRFLDLLDRSARVRVLHVAPPHEAAAIAWLRSRHDREYSHVDATSFAVMRDLDLTEAFAFDGDFSAAGFSELR